MEKTLQSVCTALDGLAKSITESSKEDRTFTEVYGWNCPPLDRHDLAQLATNLSEELKAADFKEIDKEIAPYLAEIPKKIELFKKHTMPYLWNGHALNAAHVYTSLIAWIQFAVAPLFGWQRLSDKNLLPTPLTRKLRGLQAELNTIVPDFEIFRKQISTINDATEAAETLPADLEKLSAARDKVNDYCSNAAEYFGKIDTYLKDSAKYTKALIDRKDEAAKIVSQCEEAYRIATTKGLAAAFDQRAKKLANTMWIWVGGLLVALIVGVIIGAGRFETLSKSLSNQNPHWGVIWMDFAISLFGLAAPVWFAWLATKQISQRFRLAEDYAFKASVAKAYEGYRKEAARIDPKFEARLFGSALERLEEAPLRYVEQENHGSPWQEFFNSPAFQKALDVVPDLRKKFSDIKNSGGGIMKQSKISGDESKN